MMRAKLKKVCALLVVGGVVFQCLPCGCKPCNLFTGAVTSLAMEFLTDNDAVFDLFQDDFGTGAQYDDRFVAAPSRAEPEGAAIGNLGAGGGE